MTTEQIQAIKHNGVQIHLFKEIESRLLTIKESAECAHLNGWNEFEASVKEIENATGEIKQLWAELLPKPRQSAER